MSALYDRETDRESFQFMVGLPIHCGRLAGCVEALLEHPDSVIVRSLARVALSQFEEWRLETLPAPSLHALIDEVQS